MIMEAEIRDGLTGANPRFVKKVLADSEVRQAVGRPSEANLQVLAESGFIFGTSRFGRGAFGSRSDVQMHEMVTVYGHDPRNNLLQWSDDFDRDGSTTNFFNGWSGSASSVSNVITDDDAGSVENISQAFGPALINQPYTVSIRVLKDSDQTRFPAFRLNLPNGAFEVRLNTQTGASFSKTGGGISAPDSVAVADESTHWRLTFTGTGGATGATRSGSFAISPAQSATLSGADDATLTGSITCADAQVNLGSVRMPYVEQTYEDPLVLFTGLVVGVNRISDPLEMATNLYRIEARCADATYLLGFAAPLLTTGPTLSDAEIITNALATSETMTANHPLNVEGAVSVAQGTLDTIEDPYPDFTSDDPQIPRENIEKVARTTGAVFGVAPTNPTELTSTQLLYYNLPTAAGAAAHELTDVPDHNTKLGYARLESSEEWREPGNKITALGDSLLTPKVSQDSGSQTTYGILHQRVIDRGIDKQAQVDLLGDGVLALSKNPTKQLRITSRHAGLMVNKLLTVTSTQAGINGEQFYIRSVSMRQLDYDVTEFQIEAGDPLMSLEESVRVLQSQQQATQVVI